MITRILLPNFNPSRNPKANPIPNPKANLISNPNPNPPKANYNPDPNPNPNLRVSSNFYSTNNSNLKYLTIECFA
eukprot:1140143-Amorphochlora_amoeboformis.AAC.1